VSVSILLVKKFGHLLDARVSTPCKQGRGETKIVPDSTDSHGAQTNQLRSTLLRCRCFHLNTVHVFESAVVLCSTPRWQCRLAVRKFASDSGFSRCTSEMSACMASPFVSCSALQMF
jgi:hypothetical protein